jgi:hypothetical protein
MVGRRSFLRLTAAIALTLGALVLLAAGTIAFAYPAAAAVACPACYGFERAGPNLFVEKGMSAAQRTHTVRVVAEARTRVASFYGEASRSPRILVCATQDCYRRVGGGGSRGMALLGLALLLSPRGTDAVIASHELSHVELHSRLGLVRAFRRAIPQWFDEGLAVVVSDDRRYLAAPGNADRCLVIPDGDLPRSRTAWIHDASKNDLYAKAACRVSRWIASRGGAAAVTDLIGRVAQGADFDGIYR